MKLIPDVILKMVDSKKHSMFLAYITLVLSSKYLGIDQWIWPLTVVTASVIIGQGLADFGKEGKK
jgi:hypothetical protein